MKRRDVVEKKRDGKSAKLKWSKKIRLQNPHIERAINFYSGECWP